MWQKNAVIDIWWKKTHEVYSNIFTYFGINQDNCAQREEYYQQVGQNEHPLLVLQQQQWINILVGNIKDSYVGAKAFLVKGKTTKYTKTKYVLN